MLGTPVGLQHLSRAPSTESTTGIIDSSRTGAIVGGRSGTSSSILPVGHTRAHSTPERLSHVSYLDSSDYGIRLTGRKAIGDDAILTMEMIGKVYMNLYTYKLELITSCRFMQLFHLVFVYVMFGDSYIVLQSMDSH